MTNISKRSTPTAAQLARAQVAVTKGIDAGQM